MMFSFDDRQNPVFFSAFNFAISFLGRNQKRGVGKKKDQFNLEKKTFQVPRSPGIRQRDSGRKGVSNGVLPISEPAPISNLPISFSSNLPTYLSSSSVSVFSLNHPPPDPYSHQRIFEKSGSGEKLGAVIYIGEIDR